MNNTEAIKLIQNSKHQKVRVAICDLDGVLRGKYISKEKFLSAAAGHLGFCDVVFGWDIGDVCYGNQAKFTGWHSGFPDANAHIDLNTLRHIPWNDDIPFFLADFVDSTNQPLNICPRSILKNTVARAKSFGFDIFSSLEFEFFNFKESPDSWAAKSFINPEPLTPGMFGYSLLRSSYNQEYFNALFDECAKFNIPIEGLHTETGPGVYEAAITYSDPLEAADRAILFKTACKEIGYRFEVMPSFMAKWNAELPGCSGHIHQSLWKNASNAFYDPNTKNKMSAVFEHYLAGQIKLLPEFLPMMAPTVNSYKRLVEGLWAPTRMCWGVDNRTTAFRALPGSEKSTRLETRIGGADINPYLGLAASIAAGLYGIEHQLPLGPATIGNGYENKEAVRLSANLNDATQLFEKSELAVEIFGKDFVEHFSQTRHWEWQQFETAVTNWELQRYFEIV